MDLTYTAQHNERESFAWKLPYYVAFFIIVGLCLRWTGLEFRPLHHDESIHVMFGRYFFDFPNDNYYKYNPEYHGPLLYNVLRFMYETFGDHDWSARAVIAAMGSSLLFLPWMFRRYLSGGVVLGLTAALALSPTMVYWSKFVREDMFVIFGMAMMLYGVFLSRPTLRSFWVLTGVVLQYTSKENSYVTMAIFWGYFVLEYLTRLFLTKKQEPIPLTLFFPLPFAAVILFHLGMEVQDNAYHVVNFDYMHLGAILGGALIAGDVFRRCWTQDPDQSLICRLFGHIAVYRYQFIAALLIAALLFCYLFSAGFRYPQGIVDGLYRKGITYWLEKHAVERIKGPFLFHFYQLSWYEFGFMIAVFAQAAYFYTREKLAVRMGILGVILTALMIGYFHVPADQFESMEPTFFLWQKLKLKDWLDVVGAIILLAHPMLVTGIHFARREWNLAFWGYLFTFTFLMYSYLGEKVPWLSSYPYLAGLIYLAVYIESEFLSGRLQQLRSPVSVATIAQFAGFILLGLAVWFIGEDYFRWATLNPAAPLVKLQEVISSQRSLLILGLLAVAFGTAEPYIRFTAPVHLGKFLLVIFSLFTIRIAYISNFEEKFHEMGYISQVQTTQELQTIARRIRAEVITREGGPQKMILVDGDSVWPLTWYFRDLPSYKFSATEGEKPTFNYIFQDMEDPVPDGFYAEKINLRGWWVPDFRTMTLKRFLTISVNQRTWGEPGYAYVNLLTKR